MSLPDLATYQDRDVLTPPEPIPCRCRSLSCDWCGDEAYGPVPPWIDLDTYRGLNAEGAE